ncbi:hypothetical protein CHUAL_002601 [Chamberlinius hualienensis]
MPKKEGLKPAEAYLLLYNGIQCAGWAGVLYIMIRHYAENETCNGLWTSEENYVKIFQTLAVAEILHAFYKIVPSNPLVTAVQLFSRLFIVWGIVHSFARVHNSITIPIMLAAWSVTEIIRYMYYFLNIIHSVPFALVWCRYTFFILLYPLGVIGEVLTSIFALPYIRDTQWYSYNLPNPFNISFSFYYFVILVLLAYIPGFPQLYLHMLNQRKKILSSPLKKKA